MLFRSEASLIHMLKIGLKLREKYTRMMLKEIKWCDIVRERNRSVTNGEEMKLKSEDKINLKEEEIKCGCDEIA